LFAPLGALRGFSLDAERREIGMYYGVRVQTFKVIDDASKTDRIAAARDALCWKLTRVRGLSLERAGALLCCDADTVSAAAASHEARIAAFKLEQTRDTP
jgi:hypothetical protein